MRLDFGRGQQVPDATTLLHFRHLLEKHKLGEAMFTALKARLEAEGLMMRGGSIVEATIIAAQSSTKNATGTRDPSMRQTKKGNQWCFGMKAQTNVCGSSAAAARSSGSSSETSRPPRSVVICCARVVLPLWRAPWISTIRKLSIDSRTIGARCLSSSAATPEA